MKRRWMSSQLRIGWAVLVVGYVVVAVLRRVYAIERLDDRLNGCSCFGLLLLLVLVVQTIGELIRPRSSDRRGFDVIVGGSPTDDPPIPSDRDQTPPP